MACISKLASAIAYDCDTGATGLVSAIIINKADIASFSAPSEGLVSSIVLKEGASAYKIDTVKRSLVVSASLKVNEGAPNAYTHTATIVDTADRESTSGRTRMAAYTNGSFVIITRPVRETLGSVYGLYYGMSPTSVDYGTHDNGGWTTVVASTPENVIGEDTLFVNASTYEALYAAAVG